MNIKYPLVIDGGLSNQLENQGFDLNHPLWTARLLDTNPEAIKKAHLAYLKAGAQCLITSSYQATIPSLMVQGHHQVAAEQLLLRTVQIAKEAIEDFMKSHPGLPNPLVAASIGPYGAYLADGSEYSGNYGLSEDALTEFHLSRMELLDQSSADFFACETIPNIQEAKVLEKILHTTRKQAWVSFSCKDEGHLHDGTTIEEVVQLYASHPKVFAVGINCTAPKLISKLVGRIRKVCAGKKVVAYPNSGEVYHASSKTWSDSSDLLFFKAMVNEWLDLGVDIIGGCCRLGPEYIKKIVQVINNRI